mmetsp:Transcript_30839/g.49575  ORF Transcript_30839/g.49575 Transcript_30839/m.49575 type:complete len:290 (+) Transcript_30839:53-922(+)
MPSRGAPALLTAVLACATLHSASAGRIGAAVAATPHKVARYWPWQTKVPEQLSGLDEPKVSAAAADVGYSGKYGLKTDATGTVMPAVVEPALVGGSQAATDFVNARNAQLGIAAGQGVQYATVSSQHIEDANVVTEFEQKAMQAMLGPPTAAIGSPGCNLGVEATKVGALTKRVAQLYKSMQTNDADRRGSFTNKYNAAVFQEKSRAECSKVILVRGMCSREAAIGFVEEHQKTHAHMKANFDKTPDRDRDRKGALGIKLSKQKAALDGAVACVKDVMGFDPLLVAVAS